DDRQRQGVGALRFLHFLRYRRTLFIAGIEPQSQRESHSEHVEQRLMWRDHWNERIVSPLRQTNHNQDGYRQENEKLKSGCEFTHCLDTTNIDPCDECD